MEIRESLKPLLDQLEPREKKILLLRFFKNMTQSQIADEIGVSQMHVSRLLTRTLAQLRRLAGGVQLAVLVSRVVGQRVDAGRVQQADHHDHGHDREHHRHERRVPAPEAPRERRAGSAGPSTIGLRAQEWPRCTNQANSSSAAPYTAKKPAVVTPIVSRCGGEVRQLQDGQEEQDDALHGDQGGRDDEGGGMVGTAVAHGASLGDRPGQTSGRCDACDQTNRY